jgi:hypothetical protein
VIKSTSQKSSNLEGMMAIDYNTITNSYIHHQKSGYRKIFALYFLLSSFISTQKLIKRINTKLMRHLTIYKNHYARLSQNILHMEDENIKKLIPQVEGIIRGLYALDADFSKQIKKPRFKGLSSTINLVHENLDILHATLRLLKKHSKKTPLTGLSDEANIAIWHSRSTIEKLHGN